MRKSPIDSKGEHVRVYKVIMDKVRIAFAKSTEKNQTVFLSNLIERGLKALESEKE